MRKDVKYGLATAALAAAMTTGVFVGQALARQPHMEAALESLRSAKGELEMAEHNKAGHRAEALRLTNEAIHEVEEGMDDAR